MGGVLKTIGRVVSKAAPFAGLIPGVGPLAAAGIGAGGALLGGENVLKPALMGAAGGLVNQEALGGEGIHALGIGGNPMTGGVDIGKIGKFLTKPNLLGNAEGKLDLGKALSVGAAGLDMYGQNKAMKSQQKYSDAQTDIKNRILAQLLAQPNFGIPPQAVPQMPQPGMTPSPITPPRQPPRMTPSGIGA